MCKGRGCKTPHILAFDSRLRCGQLHVYTTFPPRKISSDMHSVGGWVRIFGRNGKKFPSFDFMSVSRVKFNLHLFHRGRCVLVYVCGKTVQKQEGENTTEQGRALYWTNHLITVRVRKKKKIFNGDNLYTANIGPAIIASND